VAWEGCSANSLCLPATDTAAVRCCKHVGGCLGSVCAGSGRPPLTPGLSGAAATLLEAAIECSAQGGRLCSADEVRDCCATGCNYDHKNVWTSSGCFASPNSPPLPPSPPPRAIDLPFDDDQSGVVATEFLLRMGPPPSAPVPPGGWDLPTAVINEMTSTSENRTLLCMIALWRGD